MAEGALLGLYLDLIAENGIECPFSSVIYRIFGNIDYIMILAVSVLVNLVITFFTMGDTPQAVRPVAIMSMTKSISNFFIILCPL